MSRVSTAVSPSVKKLSWCATCSRTNKCSNKSVVNLSSTERSSTQAQAPQQTRWESAGHSEEEQATVAAAGTTKHHPGLTRALVMPPRNMDRGLHPRRSRAGPSRRARDSAPPLTLLLTTRMEVPRTKRWDRVVVVGVWVAWADCRVWAVMGVLRRGLLLHRLFSRLLAL